MLKRLSRLLAQKLRRVDQPLINPYRVLVITSSGRAVIDDAATPSAAIQALSRIVAIYRAEGYTAFQRDRFSASLSLYLHELDIFIDLALVIEPVSPHETLGLVGAVPFYSVN